MVGVDGGVGDREGSLERRGEIRMLNVTTKAGALVRVRVYDVLHTTRTGVMLSRTYAWIYIVIMIALNVDDSSSISMDFLDWWSI